jgi:hypothetical protein
MVASSPLVESKVRVMNKEVKSELDSILASYQARLVASQERDAQVKAARAGFAEAFRRLQAERIGPVLHEFAARLNEAGHQATVIDHQEGADRNGHFSPASITLSVVPARIGGTPPTSTNGRVEVTFSANQHAMKVFVSSTNNSDRTSGKRGDHDLEALTTEFVGASVLNTIREGFAITK